MKAKSIKGKSPEEIQSALEQSMADGFKPALAIVFISVKQDREAVSKLLDDRGIKDNAEQQADALIMFSCVSRYLSFGIVMKEELEQVQKIWDAPIAGFFSYGEYGKSKTGKYDYHNNTCCLVVLKEK